MALALLLLHYTIYRRTGLWFRLTNNIVALAVFPFDWLLPVAGYLIFLLLFKLQCKRLLLRLFSLGASQVTKS